MKNKKLTKSASHTSKSAFRHQNIKSEKIKLEYIRESYLEKSLKQLFLGNFTEDVTLLGTGLQITAGIFNLDLLMDIRDLTADFCNWEWSWGHLAQTTLDVVGLLPVVGVLKYGDEAFTLAKHGDELALAGGDILKCADDVSEEALKVGKNITPNVSTSEKIVEKTEEAIKGGSPSVVYGTDDIASYQYNMIENPGPLAELPNQPVKNFYGGRYNIEVLQEDRVMYRAGNTENPYGRWFTSEPPASVANVRIDTAVKTHWIDPKTGAYEASSYIDSIYAIKIPKGTTIYTGPVGPQGGAYVGGYNVMQTYIDAPWTFEVVGKTPL